MQPCASCNYESPAGAKFCRQCGAPLFAESESSGADTRNYGRQDGAPALSAPLPAPSVVDAFGGETARQYRSPAFAAPASAVPSSAGVGTASLPNPGPIYAQAAPMYVPPVSYTPPPKPKRRLLKWGGAMLALLLAGGIGAGINQENQRGRVWLSSEDRQRLDLLRREDQLRSELTEAVRERYDQLNRELDRQIEDIDRARQESNRAAERGLLGLDEKLLDLNTYEYPGATSSQFSRIPGKELLTMRTKDDFDSIVQHYQAKLGKPYLTRLNRNEKLALFQSSSGPASVTVRVIETRDRDREKIYVMRSPFRIAKPSQDALASQPETANGTTTTIVLDGKQVLTVDTKPAKPAPPAKPAQAPEVR